MGLYGSGERLMLGFEVEDEDLTTGVLLPFNSNNLEATQSINTPETKRGHLNPSEPYFDNVSVSGSITIPMDGIAFGYFLKGMFGEAVTTDIPVEDPALPWTHKHVFKKKVTDNVPDPMPYLTLERQLLGTTSTYNRYTGCKIGKISISFGGTGEFTASIDVSGSNETVETDSFHTHAEDPEEISLARFNKDQVKLVGESAESSFNTLLTTEFSLDVDFSLDADQYIIGNSELPAGVLAGIGEGVMTIGGSTTFVMEDSAMHKNAIDKKKTDMKIEVVSATSKLVIHLPEVMMSRKTPIADGNGLIKYNPEFQAFYSNAANNSEEAAIIFELYNNYADYDIPHPTP